MHPPSDYRSETWNTQLRRPGINSPRPVNVSSRKEKWLGVCVSVYHVTGFIRRTVALLCVASIKIIRIETRFPVILEIIVFQSRRESKFYDRRYWNVRCDLYISI